MCYLQKDNPRDLRQQTEKHKKCQWKGDKMDMEYKHIGRSTGGG